MMDQQFLERERELFRLNAKLNAKTKKIKAQIKVQIHTANNNLNHYPEEMQTKGESMMMGGGDEQQQQQKLNSELMCKKIHIANQPAKKPQEIVYPLFNRQPTITKQQMHRRVDIHMPSGSLISDGNADDGETFAGETLESASFKNESMITKHSYDTPNSAVPPAEPIPNMPTLPPPPTDIIPKCIEKKISNDGLMRFLKSKVAILQTELEAGKNLNDTLEKENAKNTKKVKKLQTQFDKSNAKIETLETSLKTLQENHAVAEETLKDKDAVISELNRELSTIKEELKELNHNNQVMEKKMLKSQEDCDMMKSKYESFKDIEIIMRDAAKEERIAYEEKIRKLRKGRMDLLKAYKQQIILIDNLRRQNICLEKAKALEIAEKEFLKVLDWNFADK